MICSRRPPSRAKGYGERRTRTWQLWIGPNVRVIEQFPANHKQLESLMAFVARSLEKEPGYK
jgi:hypothetical protein